MRWRWFSDSLYRRLLLILLVLALLPLMMLSIAGYNTFSTLMFEMIAESNLKTLHQVENQLEEISLDIHDIMIKTSTYPEIQKMIKSETNNRWETYLESRFFAEFTRLLMIGNPEIYKITVFSDQEKRLDSMGRFLPNKQIPEPEVYQQIKQKLRMETDQIAISSIHQIYGKKLISFGKIVLDLRTGQPIGIIVVDLDIGKMNLELKKVNLLKSGKIVLVEQGNHIIYHPEIKTGTYISESWLHLEKNKRYVLQKTDEGQQFLYLKSELASLGWTLYGIIPYEDILEKIVLIRHNFYLFLILMIVAIGIVAVSIKRVFVKPVWKLQQLMKRVQEGEFFVRANFKRKDEIGELGNSFNSMVNQIENLIEQVYQVKLNESKALLYQKQAELEALQANITPHFLYNTLHSISWFANRRGIREIQTVVDSLSSMLRYSLGNSSVMVRLIDELDYLKFYGQIIDFRYGGGINFKYSLPSSLQEVALPRLSLQPLVENTIKHGFDDFESDKWIEISVERKANDVVIKVEDNGNGIDRETLLLLQQKLQSPLESFVSNIEKEEVYFEGGMGIFNVHRRLQLCFGEKYGLQIDSKPGEGTIVQLTVPIENNVQWLGAGASDIS